MMQLTRHATRLTVRDGIHVGASEAPDPTFYYRLGAGYVRARVGELLRFDAAGRFIRVLESRTNGLGTDYRVRPGGRLERDVF